MLGIFVVCGVVFALAWFGLGWMCRGMVDRDRNPQGMEGES